MRTIAELRDLNYMDQVRAILSLETEDKVTILKLDGYSIEESIGGHWRLFKQDKLVHDDPACEDLCGNYDDAVAMFFQGIINNGGY